MEDLYKWTSIAFGLTDHKSALKVELELAQKKISDINTALSSARDSLLSMLDLEDVTCEDLALQERQLQVLGKLFMKRRVDLIHKIVTACIEGVRSFKQKYDILKPVETRDKLKLMAKAHKFIVKEKELPKSPDDSELFSDLSKEIVEVFECVQRGEKSRKTSLEGFDLSNTSELEKRILS